MKILVTGASGLVGRSLLVELQKNGHIVHALVRNKNSLTELPAHQIFEWKNTNAAIPLEAIEGCDAMIHLAGDPIADGRWTVEKKTRIQNSRWNGTAKVVEALAALPEGRRPKTLLNASAIGIYGDTGDSKVDESSPSAQDFLATTVARWEAEASKAEALGVRVCLMRFGVILARGQGALEKMGPVVLGDGAQWFSWIHIDDIVGIFLTALDHTSATGPINGTSPNPVHFADFARALARVLHRPYVPFGPPDAVLNLILGDVAQVVATGQKVLPKKAVALGYTFRHTDVLEALRAIFYPSKPAEKPSSKPHAHAAAHH